MEILVIEVDLEYVNHLPIFTIPLTQEDGELFRVWGFQRTRVRVIFPAFAPLVHTVLEDMETVYAVGDIAWSPAALDHIAKLKEDKTKMENLELPEGMEFTYEPFDHQRLALVQAIYNYRYYLALDMGLGKSKILIDIIRALKIMGLPHRTLLAVPPHLVQNWRRQIEEHGCGDLKWSLLADSENKALDVERRTAIYTSTPLYDFTLAGAYHNAAPTLLYEALPLGYSQEVYDIEDTYVTAIISGNSKARTRARTKLRKLSKKLGFDLPKGSWRVIPEERIPVLADDADILIGNYDVMVEDFTNKRLQHAQFDVFAADEAHYFKTVSSDRSKVFRKIVRGMHRCYLMSGSPNAGDPRHMYTALEMLSPVLTGGYMKFMRRYLIKTKYNENVVFGFKNLHVMNRIMGTVSLRMKQEDCLDVNIPPLQIIDVPVDMDETARTMYNALVDDWKVWLPEAGEYLEVQYGAERVTKLLQILSGFVKNSGKTSELCTGCPYLEDCAEAEILPYSKHCQVATKPPKSEIVRLKTSPRTQMTIGLIDDILQNPDNKVIVWASFTEEIVILQEIFRKRKWGHAVVHGTSNNPQGQRDKFTDDPQCRIYLSNIAISEGFTLNEAGFVIYHGVPVNLTDYDQSLKRNHRIGQDKHVVVYRVYAVGTIHEPMYRSLTLKRDVATSISDVICCEGCPRRDRCALDDVLPFDPDCIHDKKVTKLVTKPRRLE